VKKERKKATGMVAGSSGARKKQKTDTENAGSDSDDVESLLVMARADGKVYGTRDEHATTEVEANKPVDKSKQQVSSFIKYVNRRRDSARIVLPRPFVYGSGLDGDEVCLCRALWLALGPFMLVALYAGRGPGRVHRTSASRSGLTTSRMSARTIRRRAIAGSAVCHCAVL
jgi:hypothetical protein